MEQLASPFAELALANIRQEYPNKPDHVLSADTDILPPRMLHPVFYGSFDWHSSVHMHWLLARLLRLFPSLPQAPQIATAFDRHFTAANVAAELAYLQQPLRASFERTYGWAWLLKLQCELLALAREQTGRQKWAAVLQVLANEFADRYLRFLPLAQYPIRAGTHGNSAFGLLFALEYADAVQHRALRKLIMEKAHAWYGADRDYPAAYEPSGNDFLSGGLVEAVLMQRVIQGRGFADWWELFCPHESALQAWLMPVTVSDRSDPQLAHLDGLNLSRAWCWRMLLDALPVPLQDPVRNAIEGHVAASLSPACGGHYAGTHWLASFALLAMTEPGQMGR